MVMESKRTDVRGGMLPGIAAICMWMLFIALIGVMGAVNGAWTGHARFIVLSIATMMVVGVFGLLRMKRWGWAMVLAGTFLLMGMSGYMARLTGASRFWVVSLFNLCFFLYLSRTEVRERMRM